MSDTWNKDNLPENHQFMANISFMAMTEGTWQRKDRDGNNEVAPKWDFISAADENGASVQVGVFSSTDKEEIKLNTAYDIIVKRAVGKDGTFYGYSLKGFAPAGTPINKKDPQSRFQKGLKLNAKAEAIKAAAQVLAGSGITPDELIEYAQVLEAYINDEYPKPAAPGSKEDTAKPKK